jgi:hypothetical protein
MGALYWLVSYPKSGNTWLRLFLANLVLNPESPLPINRIGDFSVAEGNRHFYEQLAGRTLEQIAPGEHYRLRFELQRALQRSLTGKAFCKSHWPFRNPAGHPFFDRQATASAVYLVRNPLDVAVSLAHHNQIPYDEAIGHLNSPHATARPSANRLPEYYGDWAHHVRSWTRDPEVPTCVVRYEDLLARPKEEFTRICRFLDLRADTERVTKAVRFTDFDELQRQEQIQGFEEKPLPTNRFFRTGRAEQWREALSAEQVAAVTQANREEMARFGYV